MADNSNEVVPTAEELAAEDAALKLPTVDELKTSLATELGLDPEKDKDKLEKAAKRELDQRTVTAKAIQQKKKHREDAANLRKANPPKPEDGHGQSDLSATDVLTLVGAGVPKEDVPEVLRLAKGLGHKSIEDALKDNAVKTILATRAEERRTAEAANAGGGRRQESQATGEDALNAARTGELDEKGMNSAFQARTEQRRNRLQRK